MKNCDQEQVCAKIWAIFNEDFNHIHFYYSHLGMSESEAPWVKTSLDCVADPLGGKMREAGEVVGGRGGDAEPGRR